MVVTVDTEIVIYDGFEELDVFGPLSVLANAGYEIALVTVGDPHTVRAANGTEVVPARALGTAPELIVVPGGGWNVRADRGAWGETRRGDLPRAVAERYASGSTLAAVCTGTMLVAGAGLLEGRPAVTHRAAFDDLAAAGARVIRDARVVDDGRIVTAGGVTSGIDLALWLVERDLGPAKAAAVAHGLEHPRLGTVWLHEGHIAYDSSGSGTAARLSDG